MSGTSDGALFKSNNQAVFLPAHYKSAPIALNATGTVVAAVPGKRIKVFAIKLVVSANMTVAFRDGGSTAIEGNQVLIANSGFVENVDPPAFLFGTSVGNSLDMVVSGVGAVGGRVSYWDDDDT